MKDISNFDIDDFLSDKDFKSWVYSPSLNKEFYWQNLMCIYPEKKEILLRAKGILLNIKFQEYVLPEAEKDILFSRINIKIEDYEKRVLHKNSQKKINWVSLAAIFILLFTLGIAIPKFLKKKELVYKTGFAQSLNINLPDGSVVLLRANSSLRFKEALFNNEVRNVWLHGDAIFKIKHLSGKRKFVVHTSKIFGIQDVGTEFLVHARSASTMVYLHEGKIKLLVEEKNNLSAKTLLMKPGETATFSNNRPDLLTKQKGVVAGIASWDGKSLLLNNTPMSNILGYLKDNYGFKIIMKDSRDLTSKVSGKIPLTNLNFLLESLSAIYDIHFKIIDSKTLIISN